jgi:hypothetical protein
MGTGLRGDLRRAGPAAALCAALLSVSAPPASPAEEADFALHPGWTESSYPPLPRARWQALPFPALWAIEDGKGRIWLGAPPPRRDGPGDAALVARVKRNVEAAFLAERPLVWGAEFLRFDGAGRVWAVVRGRAFHVLGYDGQRWLEVPLDIPADGLNPFAPGDFYEDARGRVWFRGVDQVCRFEDGRFIGMPVPRDAEAEAAAEEKKDPPAGAKPPAQRVRPSFVGSSDGLVLIEAWSRGRKRWFFRDGKLFHLTHPLPAAPAGRACWPLPGGRIYFAGCRPLKAVVALDGRDDEERLLGEVVLRLGDDRFEEREKATREILRRYYSCRGFLESAREKAQDPEMRHRLQFILDSLDADPSGGECWTEEEGPWILGGDFLGVPPRGPGFVATLSLRMPGRDRGVFWVAGTGERIRLPVEVREDAMQLDFDGAGRPLVGGEGTGPLRMVGDRFERVIPESWSSLVERLHAVDREGRAYFTTPGGSALHLYDPAAPERPAPAAAWTVRGRADWLAADSLGRVWANVTESGDASGLCRTAGDRWDPFRFGGHPVMAPRVIARGTGGALLLVAGWKEASEEPAPTDRSGVCLAGAGEPRFADALSALALQHREILRERFAATPRGPVDAARLVADGGGRAWYVELLVRGGTVRNEIFTCDASIETPVSPAVEAMFPAWRDARALLRVPGGGAVAALFEAPETDGPPSPPLVALAWGEGKPAARELGPRGREAVAAFVAGDGTLHVGSPDRPGVTRVRAGGVAERGDGFLPQLEHPDGTLWSFETARAGEEGTAVLALVVESGRAAVRLPLGTPGLWTPPAADSKGRVWISFADRVIAVRLDGGALRVEREIPWDRPGRRVMRLYPDADGRLWAWDAATRDVLSLGPVP